MSDEQQQQKDTATEVLSAATQKLLIRHLTTGHPLPWHVELDWTVEVTDAAGAIVIKCMHIDQANEIIELAKLLAEEDAIAREEIERMLQESAP